MPSIRITEFGGMKPKDVRSEGGPSRAFLAKDVKLWHGTLEPWRYPALETSTSLTKICSLYQQECCWIASENKCADYTMSDTDCNKVYSSGHMDWPAYAMLSDPCDKCCYEELEWCRLGIPKPLNPPEITSTPVVSDPIEAYDGQGGMWKSDTGEQLKREPRSYIYTFVNECGEESAPSDPSEVVDVDIDDISIQLGIVIPALEEGFCNPVSIRIYRGVPAQQNDSDPSVGNDGGSFYNSVNATYLFTKEIDWQEGVVSTVDDTPADCLEEACMSECHNPPPECLEGLTVTENGCLVGFEGKNLWFSEPWKFHAWDCHLNLDDCIKAIKYVRGSIYVATDGYPYIINSDYGPEDCLCCRQVNKLTEPAPITCKQSMVSTATGVMWATNVGLVKMDGNSFQVITHGFLAEDDWQKYMPHQIRGVYNKGRYFGFNDHKGFIWDTSDGVYSESYLGEASRFTELSLTPDSVFSNDQNELYMSFDGGIYRWDASDEFMPYQWVSKLNVEGGLRNYSTMKIVFKDWLRTRIAPNPVTVKFYADDKLVFAREVNCSRPFRLPKGFDALNFQIELTGIEEVMEVHMATSMMELTALNNS